MEHPPELQKALELNSVYYAVLSSLYAFDETEVRGVVNCLLNPMLPEECFISTYYRAVHNVASLLELKSPRHYQAISMLARSLFELAVDMALLNTVKGAPVKMRVFLDLEKLRASKSVVTYQKRSGLTLMQSDETYREYITKNEARILGLTANTWPNHKNGPKHWSGVDNLKERAALIASDYEERYACFYKSLSWGAHAGLQGSYGMQPQALSHLCSMALDLAAWNYKQLLLTMIRALKLSKHDPLIEKKIKLAEMLPYTESVEQEAAIRQYLGLS